MTPAAKEAGRLLPCPFCGLDVTDDEGCFPLNNDRTLWEVRCGDPSCFAHDPAGESREAAVARWNRRFLAEPGDAVAWQQRIGNDWPGAPFKWHEISREEYEARKVNHYFQDYEFRELFTHPAAPVGVSE